MVIVLLATGESVFAQTDEIQVYDASHADPGKFNLTWHDNFTPSGIKTPPFPGAITSDESLNGVTEWAYGVNAWFEAGLYMPLYSIDKHQGATLDGFKLRALLTVPHAAHRRFVYGLNFEFSVNSKHWDMSRNTSEIRPIIGWHLKPLDVIVDPILDTAYDGVRNLDFAPSIRIAHHLSDTWALAVEEYADYGPLRQFRARGEQAHQLFAVVDHSRKVLDIEVGVGMGLTDASDTFTVKLILARDLN
jgi:hypothetical protein